MDMFDTSLEAARKSRIKVEIETNYDKELCMYTNM